MQWRVAGDVLWRRRRLLAVGSRSALHLRLWQLSPTRATGLQPLGLPIEEAAFFLLTSVLVLFGLVLFVALPPPPSGTSSAPAC